MKLFKEFIREQRVTTAESGYTVQPKNKEELSRVIWDTIKKEGLDCDLNFIDTSLITDMSHLFAHTRFNGKIDKWDVLYLMLSTWILCSRILYSIEILITGMYPMWK